MREDGVQIDIDFQTNHTDSQDSMVENLPQGDISQKKRIIGCLADGQRLPFPDKYFDGYLSNLAVMHV